jgi:mannose-1-phosphate guanylyltransferase / mannose-6-phosphate isomerase
MNLMLIPIVMCGGSGTRMWPESRESLPKQFIPLVGDESTFQSVIRIVSDRSVFAEPIVLTNSNYRFRVAEQLAEIGATATILLEPERRDSGPAVAVAAYWAARIAPDAVVAMLAADHVFGDGAKFVELCSVAAEAAKGGAIVTFGVPPDHPATGYGYIQPEESLGAADVRKVKKFVEKPDSTKAKEYIEAGYLWNSGNFVFRADVMKDEIASFEPEMGIAAAVAVDRSKQDLGFIVLDRESFGTAPKKSIDYAVMERTAKAAVIVADVGWSDIGEWAAVWRISPKKADGNVLRGNAVAMDSKNLLVRSPDKLTAVIGLEDVIVITTPDAVLVAASDSVDKVKLLVEKLKSSNRIEATEHKRSYRPWGYYQSVDQGERHQVKRITVYPAARLSLQKHFHRSEHWIVVRGAAEVTMNGRVSLVHENQSIYLPIGCEHRLANPGKINLELIEVQTGSYLGEDDIIRIEDVYNRS